jgi:hypothetical protein
MPNTNQVWNKETETQLIIQNLYALQKFLNKLNKDDNWENHHKYIITENKYDGNPKVYELLNLKIDSIEDGDVIFDDGAGVLMENMYNNTPFSLHHMLIDNICLIDDNGTEIMISGSTYIKIKY